MIKEAEFKQPESGKRFRRSAFELLYPRRREKAEEVENTSKEKERRARIAELAGLAAELDEAFFSEVKTVPVYDPFAFIEARKAVETLTFGRELGRKVIAEDELPVGVNAITRRVYEGDPPRIAYVKTGLGEASFRCDRGSQSVFQVSRRPTTEGVEEMEVRFADASVPDEAFMVHYFSELARDEWSRRRSIAAHYGIDERDVPLTSGEFMPRKGVDLGKTSIREYAVSRINELLGFGVVPMTVLRAEEANADIASVQEAVKVTDQKNPPKPMDVELYRDVLQRGPKHPAAKSFMRIACLDALVKMLDRHPGNILYDPVAQTCQGIDNGLSFGLSAKNEKLGKSALLDPLRSIALEIVQQHPDWKLDDEARAELQQILDSTKAYLSSRESPDEDSVLRRTAGKEIKYITKLFRLMHDGNERVAKMDALDFFQTLSVIVATGRPPHFNIGVNGGELFPLAENYFPDALNGAEEAAAAA